MILHKEPWHLDYPMLLRLSSTALSSPIRKLRSLVAKQAAQSTGSLPFGGFASDRWVLQKADDLRRLLDGPATAHEADLRTAFAQHVPARRRNISLSLKDLRPDPLEANDKGRRSFKQWSDKLKAWT